MVAQTPREENNNGRDKNYGGRPRCKYCQGETIVKAGKQNGHQRWLCRECGHRFDENGKPPKMRHTKETITTALDLYFEGLSLRKVQRHLKRHYGIKVSFRKILGWIEKYVPLVEEFVDDLEPKTSGIWHADETALKFQHGTPCPVARNGKKVRRRGKQYYFWDAVDERTRYLIGCHLGTREYEDGVEFFRRCQKAGGRPNAIITDGLLTYPGAINKVYYSHFKHRRVRHIPTEAIPNTRIMIHNQLIERFHGTLDDRVNVMRGLKSQNTKVLRGFRIHYNFLRPHESLDGITPAEAAGIHLPFEDGWGDLIAWATTYQNLPGEDDDGDYVEINLVFET